MTITASLGKGAKKFSEAPASLKVVVVGILVGALVGAYAFASQRGCVGRDLGEMDRHLSQCGKVLVVGENLRDLDSVEGCELIPVAGHAAVEKALKGRDEAALVRAMRDLGAAKILVSVDDVDPQLMPPPTLRRALGTYRSLDRLHAVYLSQAAGLFEITEPFRVSDRAGEELVSIARTILSGRELPEESRYSEEVRRRREPQIQVSVALQGLRPIERNSRSVNFNRRDFYIVRGGSSLLEATRETAERVRDRWEPTGSLEREGELAEAIGQLNIEVEILHDRTPIALVRSATLNPTAYRQYLWNAVELGVHGLEGRVGDERRYLLPSSAIYRARPDVDSFVKRLARNFDLNGDGRENDDDEALYASSPTLEVHRFRTHHFREMEPNGEVKRLLRSFVPVEQDAITRDTVEKSVRLAAEWLVHNQRDDGLFEYKYYPTRDTYYREFHDDVEEAHNIVRHGLAAYSLLMVAADFDDEEMLGAGQQALEVMLDNSVIGPGWYTDSARRASLLEERRESCDSSSACTLPEECIEGTCRLPFGPPMGSSGERQQVAPSAHWESHDGYRRPLDPLMIYVRWKDVGKMGAVAAAVMALTELIAERPELLERYRFFLEGYWRFLRFMQKSDGSFNHYFTAPGDVRYYSTETSIYPGEILFALSRIYRLLGDEAILESFDRGIRYYAQWFRHEVAQTNADGTYSEMRRNDLVAFAPWVTMAANDMYVQRQERFYAEIGVEVSDWCARRYQYDPPRTFYSSYLGSYYRVWWEQAAMHGIVYTEGTAAAFNLARRAGDRDAAERMRRSTLLGIRFAVQQIVRPGVDDHFLPGHRARMRSRGCVRFSLTVSDCRTDYTYHSLSAMMQTLRYFGADDWSSPLE